MGLFGEFSTNRPKKNKNPTLFEMAKERFDDIELLEEINLFLKSCREKRLMPSRISWEMQLEILEQIAEDKRVEKVHNSILKGYRQIAYADNTKEVKKVSVGNIIKEGF